MSVRPIPFVAITQLFIIASIQKQQSESKETMEMGNLLTGSQLILILSALSIVVDSKCTDQPKCFEKILLNFNFPQMNLYAISAVENQEVPYEIKAYGDFNQDLFTDYAAYCAQSSKIYLFVWNTDSQLFEVKYQTNVSDTCEVKTIYLYDSNEDGNLDFVVWGEIYNDESKVTQNCLIPFVRVSEELDFQIQPTKESPMDSNKYEFKAMTTLKMKPTTDPILITFKFQNNRDCVGFLVFKNGERKFLKYRDTAKPQFDQITWTSLATDGLAYRNIGFGTPHWNIYMDVTGDCQPDLIIYNQKHEIQVWAYASKAFKQINTDQQSLKNVEDLRMMSISDINYDGSGDLILAFSDRIHVHLNKRSVNYQDQFCSVSLKDFSLENDPIVIEMPPNKTIEPQSLHFGDIDINGYPDILMILTEKIQSSSSSNNQSEAVQREIPALLENRFAYKESTFKPFSSPSYNVVLESVYGDESMSIHSVSFIDILENGILDIAVVTESKLQSKRTSFIYNNFLLQNYFFIKGYGMLGPDQEHGSLFPALSFYWVNSLGDELKVTYQTQTIQTGYDSLQLPYTYCGLGRANNYVEDFTIGRNGKKQTWSPIIPNSQLGVYTMHSDPEKWTTKLFAFPVKELTATIIVTSIVLLIFGMAMAYINCKNLQRKEEPLMMQFIS